MDCIISMIEALHILKIGMNNKSHVRRDFFGNKIFSLKVSIQISYSLQWEKDELCNGDMSNTTLTKGQP